MVWGAGKVGAIISAALAKKHVAAVPTKWLMNLGAGKVLKSLREINDGLLASGAQNKEVHAVVASSISKLETQLQSVAESERLQVLKTWLAEAEKKTPQLVVALGHAYLDNFKSVKVAKSLVKGIETEKSKVQQNIAGCTAEDWERKIHEEFPALKGYRVVLEPKEESRK
jgi:hypothetical protein